MMDAAGLAALQPAVPTSAPMSGTPLYPKARNHAPKMTGAARPTHSNRQRAKQIATGKALTGDTGGGAY